MRRFGGERRILTWAALLSLVLTAIWSLSPPASAQEVSPSATPSPSVSPSPEPSPEPSPSPTVEPSPSLSPSPSLVLDPSLDPIWRISGFPRVHRGAGRILSSQGHDPGDLLTRAEGRRHRRPRSWKGWAPDPHWGTYGTALLDRAARRARQRGWDGARIARQIYAPFIVVGPATWSDSWGAPRFAGGYHPHHGQDVLCRYGAPVLAAEPGTVRFGTDPLGGRVAYLDRPGGGFWYYAHLKSYAPDLVSGDRVKTGRVIGRCGASGDASVPHVHFAFFTAEHRAVDPMRALVAWLHTAERRVRSDHPDHKAPEPAAARPPFRIRARAGSDGLAGLAVPTEPLSDTDPSWSPRQRAIGTAAFMMLFGSALWAVPVRRKRADTRPFSPFEVTEEMA